jgi:hypothetical protein
MGSDIAGFIQRDAAGGVDQREFFSFLLRIAL